MHQNWGGSVSFNKSLSKETFTMDSLYSFLRACVFRGGGDGGGGGGGGVGEGRTASFVEGTYLIDLSCL